MQCAQAAACGVGSVPARCHVRSRALCVVRARLRGPSVPKAASLSLSAPSAGSALFSVSHGASAVSGVAADASKGRILWHGVHHVALLCSSLEASLEFYQGILGLDSNPDRPHDKLPYRGAWLWIGPEMIHLMELPNPDSLEGRPKHGGRDRHFCVGVEGIAPLEARLAAAGVEYTRSMSGRPAIFFRDPDANCLEVVELGAWR